jgi:hypothetical protein
MWARSTRRGGEVMTIYYVTTSQTYFRDYKVEANSEEEAERIVMTSKEDALTPYQEDWGGDLQVEPESTCTEEEENS